MADRAAPPKGLIPALAGAAAVLAAAVIALSVAFSRRAPLPAQWIGMLPETGMTSFTKAHMPEMSAAMLEDLRARQGRLTPVRNPVPFPRDFLKLRFVRVVLLAPRNHHWSGFHVVLANDAALASPEDRLDDGSLLVKLQFPAGLDPVGNLYPAELESLIVLEKDSRRYPAETEGMGFEIFTMKDGLRFVSSMELQRWCFDCHRKLARKTRLFTDLRGGVRAQTHPKKFRPAAVGESQEGKPPPVFADLP